MTHRLHHHAARLFGLCLLASLIGMPAEAASPRAQLQRDRGTCARIPAGDAHQNCLSEASTAFASTRPSAVNEDPDSLARNATRRCEALPEVEQRYCMARMRGQGTTSGSVAGGGIYRELVTRETEAPVMPPAAPPADAAR